MLEKLIEEGEHVRLTCVKKGDYSTYVTGEDYNKWMAKGLIFMQRHYEGDILTERFVKASEGAAGNDVSHLDEMLGILKALNEYEG